MIPTVVVERVLAPGNETLTLYRRGEQFMLRVGGIELMSSHDPTSERELGRLSCEPIQSSAPKVMIGGLGLGFTLRAALDALPATARVEVVELIPDVVRWNRTVFGHLAGHPLDDRRVTVIEDDVANVIARGRDYDAIILDVDNGPSAIYRGNERILGRGLAALHAALSPGSLFTLWSCFRTDSFTRTLQRAGFDAEVRPIKRQKGNPRHFIWFATKPRVVAAPRPATKPRPRPGAARPRRSRGT